MKGPYYVYTLHRMLIQLNELANLLSSCVRELTFSLERNLDSSFHICEHTTALGEQSAMCRFVLIFFF